MASLIASGARGEIISQVPFFSCVRISNPARRGKSEPSLIQSCIEVLVVNGASKHYPLGQSISRTRNIIPIPSYRRARRSISKTATNPIDKIIIIIVILKPRHPNNVMSNSKEVVLYTEQYTPWFWPMLIVVFPIMPLFWKYHVTITEKELSFGYSSKITSKRVDCIFIKEVVPLFDQKWNGWGIHYHPPRDNKAWWCERWERQYIAKNGGAVKLLLGEAGSDKTTIFFFSTEDPQKVCDIILNKEKSK